MKSILKIVIPICFLGLIGLFVFLNSNWYAQPSAKPGPVQKGSQVQKTPEPSAVKASDKEQHQVAETSDSVKPAKTLRSKTPVVKEEVLTEEETRQLIMSSSKSMKVAPVYTPDTAPPKIDFEKIDRTTIMPSSKSAPMRIGSPFSPAKKKK